MKKKPGIITVAVLLLLISCTKSDDNVTINNNNNNNNNNPRPDSLNGWKLMTAVSGDAADIWFLNSSKGFVCGTFGVFKSTDSAATWTQVVPKTDTYFNIHFPDSRNGFIIGSKSIARTFDGGDSWSVLPLPTGIQEGHEVYFFNGSTGYMTSSSGLFKTVDSAKTWQLVKPGKLFGLFFLNGNVGWVGAEFSILFTSDGGFSLKSQSNTSSLPLFMDFIDANNGFAGTSKELMKTTNGGTTWSKIFSGDQLFDFHFFNLSDGWLINKNKILKTSDGGLTWVEEMKLGSEETLIELHAIDKNNVFACGINGKILRLKR